MKKIYLQPEVFVTNLRLSSTILEGSLTKSTDKVGTTSGGVGGWTNEDRGWDIWGNDAESDDWDE